MSGFSHSVYTDDEVYVEFGHDLSGRFFIVGDVEDPIVNVADASVDLVVSLLKQYFIGHKRLNLWIQEFMDRKDGLS